MPRPKLSVAFTALALAATVGACSPRMSNNGNLVENERLSELRVGVTTKEDAATVLGTPSAVATFDANTWYYIGQVTERVAFFRPNPVERRVVTLRFDDEGVLRSLDDKSLADGNAVDVVDRATPTPGTESSIIQQILGNVGRFPGASRAPANTPPGRSSGP